MRASLLLPVTLVSAALWACSGGEGGLLSGGDEGWGSGAGAGADGGGALPPGADGGGPAPSDAAPPPKVDGSAPAVDAGAKDAAAPVDAGACINGVASPGSGHHDPGQDCKSCHDNLGANRKWTVAGTLYAGVNSNTPVVGATIEVVDATNKVLQLVTYSNGNFYTLQSVTYPLKVRATKCPSNVPMNGSVANGSCNAGGCHEAGNRIHLP
jgi:hypothetical protein